MRGLLAAVICATTVTLTSTRGFNYQFSPSDVLKHQLIQNQNRHDLKTAKELLESAPVDPVSSWKAFQNHQKVTKSRRRKGRRRLKSSRLLKGLRGPVGPPGPRGPKGSPGAEISKDELLQEFRKILQEAIEKKLDEVKTSNCSSIYSEEPLDDCVTIQNRSTGILSDILKIEAATVPRITNGFHSKLSRNYVIPRRTFLEVKYFQLPFETGSFQRGEGVDVETGRYVASRTGIYQLSANIQVQHKALLGSKFLMTTKVKKSRTIRILVCIQGQCHNNASLVFLSGLDSNSRIFTVSANGVLHLKKGQYVSVFVDNSSRFKIHLLNSSTFSGVLLGV